MKTKMETAKMLIYICHQKQNTTILSNTSKATQND